MTEFIIIEQGQNDLVFLTVRSYNSIRNLTSGHLCAKFKCRFCIKKHAP